MKTIEYTLKSKPEFKVKVPIEYAQDAETLVSNSIISLDIEKDTPKALKFQDEVYLTSCIHSTMRNISQRSRKERKIEMKISEDILSTLRGLDK